MVDGAPGRPGGSAPTQDPPPAGRLPWPARPALTRPCSASYCPWLPPPVAPGWLHPALPFPEAPQVGAPSPSSAQAQQRFSPAGLFLRDLRSCPVSPGMQSRVSQPSLGPARPREVSWPGLGPGCFLALNPRNLCPRKAQSSSLGARHTVPGPEIL